MLCGYLPNFVRTGYGERYEAILRYFFPELISAFLLYSALSLFDSIIIGGLRSTSTYAAFGLTNQLLHNIIKLAEGFSVSATILTGRFNGIHSYSDVGRTARDIFWITFLLGAFFALLLYVGAPYIYVWYNVPESMSVSGIPFLRLRAFGVLFSFVYLGFCGFLRGIKNTTVPMYSFVVGGLIFVFFDYALVCGAFGFPALGLQGSAIASIIQSVTMALVLLLYILFDEHNRRYAITLFQPLKSPSYMRELVTLSIPVAIDKVVFAMSYTWLYATICPMGKYWAATYTAVRDMEKIAILPALAFAQVITFLVSNDYAKNRWDAIRSNINKALFLSTSLVVPLLIIFSLWPQCFVSFFDRKGAFIGLTAYVFPIVSIFVIFDLLQLILAGALRGAGDVKTVMWTRIAVFILYFWPVSYFITYLSLPESFRFIMLYASFYLGTAFMSIIYINRLRGTDWQNIRDI